MKNLRVWQKLTLMGFVLLIPFAVVLWQLVASVHRLNIDPARDEILGVEYLMSLRKVMREVQGHRAMTQALLTGDESYRARVSTQKTVVTDAVRAMDETDARIGTNLKTQSLWPPLRDQIRSLMDANETSATKSFSDHNARIADIISLTQYVGDTSTLTLDPDLDSYYLMNVIVFRQPELSENLGQARTAGVIGLNRRRFSQSDRSRLVELAGVNEYLVRDVNQSLQKAIEQNGALSEKIGNAQQTAGRSTSEFLQLLQAISRAPQGQSARQYFNVATQAINATYDLSDAASPALDGLLRTRIQLRQQQILSTILWSFLGLVIVSFIGWLLILDITRPLRTTVGIAEQIASGDLSAQLSDEARRDELGTLTKAFNRMTDSLRDKARLADEIAAGNLDIDFAPPAAGDMLGQSLFKMLENLRGMTGNITTAVHQLSSSSSQILASTSQLSATASETASAVSQTTTTVEEVRQTAHVSNEKAQQVAHTSQHAAQIADEGKDATEHSTLGMQRIREQMEAIAQSMIRLSEQSSAIGEIIASVDDLTQQSNLLAVNAAIEAAKAGEQGKGFAVVAQEVKNLADQSRQATGQVRTILSDIQKATGAAVMATELGTKVVEAGVAQSGQAGDAILRLSEGIEEAAQASIQIAASSQQQLIGVDQVAIAMDSVRQASLQNVDSAHQLEVAARDLNNLGLQLKEIIAQYRV